MNTEEYGRMFDAEDTHWWYLALHARVRDACKRFAPDAARILDLGCGTGAMAAQLDAQANVLGVDYAPEALTFCRGRGLTRLARADAAHLPLQSASVDAVLLLDLLYHQNIGDPSTVLREVHRVLAPGGAVLINVPAYYWLRSSHDVAVHTGRRFTRPEILALLRDAGFETCAATYWNTLLFPAIVLLRIGRRCFPPKGSDVAPSTSPALNKLLGGFMACERALTRRFPLPFGLSIFAIARKAAE